jgi:UDP-glucose 4-epimerase
MSEWVLQDVFKATPAFRHVILRYFNVAGADPDGRLGQSTPDATHLIKVACQTALGQRERLAILGTDYPTPDGTGVRDYVHVSFASGKSDLFFGQSAQKTFCRVDRVWNVWISMS